MSFAIVLFADGKSHIFNTNCRNISLLQSLRQTCNEVLRQEDQIDLADENGECKNLSRSLEAYASDVIAPRERLVLLRVEEASRDENLANTLKFIPLLNGLQENKDFLSALNPTNLPKGSIVKPTARLVAVAKKTGNLTNLAGLLGANNTTRVQSPSSGATAARLSSVASSLGSSRTSRGSSGHERPESPANTSRANRHTVAHPVKE